MQVERVDHHEIVGQAEIFHRESVARRSGGRSADFVTVVNRATRSA